MRITGAIRATEPTLSSTGTYSFKIASNGLVTKGSTYGNISAAFDTASMTNIFDGYRDDNSESVNVLGLAGFPANFLGTTYNTLYVSGNGGFSFGEPNDVRGNGESSGTTPQLVPCIFMNNNDSCLNQIWYAVVNITDVVFKIRGNTNFDNSPYNFEYDIYLRNDGTVDVFVVQEPTSWADYSGGQGNVIWGVTDGTNWVDGLPLHTTSLGGILNTGRTGLRITGGLRLGATLPIMRWDPTHLAGNVVLDNNNTSFFDINSGSFSINATIGIPASGLYMYTVRMDYNYDSEIPDIGGYIGVGNINFDPLTNLGADTNSIGFSDTGLLFYNGGVIDGGYPNFNVNATRIIDVAILNRTYLWYRIDGGDWNGNPSSDLTTGTGGVDISGYSLGEIYPIVTVAGDIAPTQFDIIRVSPYGVPAGATNLNMYSAAPPSSKSLTWNGIYWVPVPVGQQQTIEILYSNWDNSDIFWEIYGEGIVTGASGDFAPPNGTISNLTGSGLTTINFVPNPSSALKTYYVKFGSTFGGNDYLDAQGPYGVKNIFAIGTSDLTYSELYPGSTSTTNGFVTDGSWNGRIKFTGDTTLESDWTTLNGMTNGVYAATWSSGSSVTTGYVYLQNPTATGGFVLLTPCDGSGTAPAAGTYIFPVVLSPEV